MNFVIIFCAKYLIVAVALGLVVAWLRIGSYEKKQFLAATVLAGAIALVLARIAAHFYFDPRPFVTEHIAPLIPHAADNGFPSDHALLTMTLTAATYCFSKKMAAVMLVLTVLVGVARIMARIHSPLDIAGAWLLGIIGAIAGYYIMLYLFHRYGKSDASVRSNA